MSPGPLKERQVALVSWTARLIGGGSMMLLLLLLIGGSATVRRLGLGLDLGLGTWSALAWDLGLSLVFFVQHSGMIRIGFRKRLERMVDPVWHGAIYAVSSGLVLIVLVILWQPTSAVVARLAEPWRWLAWMAMAGVIVALGLTVRGLRGFDAFGVAPLRRRLREREERPVVIAAAGAYAWVRHPLYLLVLILIWLHPDLTADRLLLNLTWTVWVVIGTILEERDLVSSFGDEYRRYQQMVPMLVPWRRPVRGAGPVSPEA